MCEALASVDRARSLLGAAPPLDQLRNPIIRAMEDIPFKAFEGVEIERLVWLLGWVHP